MKSAILVLLQESASRGGLERRLEKRGLHSNPRWFQSSWCHLSHCHNIIRKWPCQTVQRRPVLLLVIHACIHTALSEYQRVESQGQQAVEALESYEEVVVKLNESLYTALEANKTLMEANEALKDISAEELSVQAAQSRAESERLMNEAAQWGTVPTGELLMGNQTSVMNTLFCFLEFCPDQDFALQEVTGTVFSRWVGRCTGTL